MKNLTDWFDRVYVINCAHRPDRLEETKKHLEETKMADNDKVIYYPAIIGDWTTCPADWGSGRGAWGCVLPSNKVSGRITTASKARYTGDAVRIITRGGEDITLTVNHPILTKKGFVRAGDMDEGMDLLRYSPKVKRSTSRNDVDNEPTLASEVFNSFLSEGHTPFRKRSSNLDFYGDGESIHGDIEIVDINSPLLDPVVRTHRERTKKREFAGGHFDIKGPFPHLGSSKLRGSNVCSSGIRAGFLAPRFLTDSLHSMESDSISSQHPSDSTTVGVSFARKIPSAIIKGFHQIRDVFTRFVSSYDFSLFFDSKLTCVGQADTFPHTSDWDIRRLKPDSQGITVNSKLSGESRKTLPVGIASTEIVNHFRGDLFRSSKFQGFGAATELDSSFGEFAFDNVDAEIVFYTDLLERHPSVVKVDEILSIERFHYDGEVYDFGTTVGHFTVSHQEVNDGSGIIVSNCLRSHQRILEDVIHDRDERGQMNCTNVLIMEDDVIFKDNPLERLNNFMKVVPEDWGQIYLGGQHRRSTKGTEDPNVVIGGSINRTHAYAVNQPTLTALYRHISYATDYRGSAKHIDHQLELAHRRADWPVYCPKEWIAGQRAGSSNISGKQLPTKFW